MIRQVANNIIAELKVLTIAYEIKFSRWYVEYEIVKSYIEPVERIEKRVHKTYISVAPDFVGEEAFVQKFTNIALSDAEDRLGFVEYVDDTDELWENEYIPEDMFVAEWIVGENVAVGFLRKYNGVAYRAIQKHTTQSDWTPDVATALWIVAPTQGATGYDEWIQPTGAHDAYNIGDIVEHNGHVWKSKVNGNVWEPQEGALWEKLD